MKWTDTAAACNNSPSGGRGSEASQPICSVDSCKREPQETGRGDPEGKTVCFVGRRAARLPPATALQKQSSVIIVVTVTAPMAFQSPSRTGRAEGIHHLPTRSARKVTKAFSWRRKAMSLINPELHKERERVREEINEGESLLCFILSLLI